MAEEPVILKRAGAVAHIRFNRAKVLNALNTESGEMFLEICQRVAADPHAGSDASNVRTRFQPDGDEIVINGQKIFITTGDVADVVLWFGKWTEIEDSPRARERCPD